MLIRTKLTRLPTRPEFVERRGLVERLDMAVEQHRITLVSAPPGFGKTTLTTQWLAQQPVPTAWLALDKADSDPDRFVRYLVAAVFRGQHAASAAGNRGPDRRAHPAPLRVPV